jgi:hypothetical protein
MRKMLLVTVFTLATLAWMAAQQSSGAAERSGGQATSPSSQAPGASQPQPSTPGSAGQAGSQSQTANAPVTEGCLGGSNPNFTITDKAGTTYKLNIPPGADASSLTSHVGESVQVMGEVKDASTLGKASIDVSRMGRGTGKCPASSPSGTQPPPQKP